MRVIPIKQPVIAFFLLTFGLALSYYLLSQAGLLTAITPFHVAVFWPPAGLALAAVILVGGRSIFGIWLGAFISEFFLFLPGLPIPTALTLAFAISLGITLQALVTGWCFHRWVQFPPHTIHGKRFLIFMAVAATGCLISASFGTLSLSFYGIIPLANAAMQWGIWYLGDWFGVLAFTPLCIVIHQMIQKKSFISQAVMLTISTGIILSTFVFMLLWQAETQRIELEFFNNAKEVEAILGRTIQLTQRSMDFVMLFITHHDHVSRSEFHDFVTDGLLGQSLSTGMQSIQWVPVVPAQARESVEAQARQEGFSDFHFTELNTAGTLIPAGKRDTYFPVYYQESLIGDKNLLGVDLGSSVRWQTALQEALQSGFYIVSDPLPFLDEPAGQKNLVIIRPTFRHGSVLKGNKPREADLLGFVISVYRFRDLIEPLIEPLAARGRDAYLFDPAQPEGDQLLYFRPSQSPPHQASPNPRISPESLQDGIYYSCNLAFGDHTWLLIIRPTSGWANERRSWIPWMSFIVGITITAWFSTRQFYQLRVSLMEQENQSRMMLALENARLGYWNYDPETGRMICSSGFETIFGVPSRSFETFEDIYHHLHPEDAERLSQAFHALLQGGHTLPDFEGRLIRPDGEERWVIARGIAYQGTSGKIAQVMGIIQDITERKRAYRELREGEQRYRSLIENSHDLIVSLDKDGRVLLANNTFLNTFARDGQTVRNQIIFDFLSPENRLEYQRLFAQYLSVGEPIHPILAEVITHDGRRVELEGTLSEQVVGDQVISIDGFFRDVTERRKMERIEIVQSKVTRILAESPEITDALGQVIETIANGLNWQMVELWWLDPETNHLQWKTGWHEPKEAYEALELASRGMQVAYGVGIPGRTWQAGRALWSNAQAEEISLRASLLEAANLQASLSIPMYHHQELFGVMVFFSCSWQPADTHLLGIMDDLGRQIGQFVARKQAEQSLAHAEAIYRVLFYEAPVMYVISKDVSSNPVIQNCNNLFLKHLGYDRDEVIGRPLGDFYTPDSRKKMERGAYRLALAGQYSAQERELVRRDGTIIQVVHYALPELNRNGKLQGIRSMFVDITARKQMEQAIEAERALLAQRVAERTAELRVMNAELQHANRAKDEFLANTSHELRTPLNAILSFAEILLEQVYGPLNEPQIKAIQTMQGSGQHLLELINDILDLSKIEAGKLELHKEVIALEQACQASLLILKEIAVRKQLQLEYFNQQPDLLVEVDPRRLKQILVNLLSNAVKFTPPGGKVQLYVEGQLNADIVHISVLDSGIGIAEEDQKRLFRSFVQIDGSLTRSQDGTGLGLALVWKLVDLHGGSVSLQSSPGEGSRFTISLPCYRTIPIFRTEADLEVKEHKKPYLNIETKTRILLAEDNEVNAMAVGEYLQVLGYEIKIAQNGQEAIDRANTWDPHLILMDIQMPIMDGLEAIRHLRTDPRFIRTPIIALTALAMVGDREKCLSVGATEYLSKPASLKGLVKLIEDLLQKAREPN